MFSDSQRLENLLPTRQPEKAVGKFRCFGIRLNTQNKQTTTNPLWERACSRSRWVSHRDVGCAAVIASRLTPTGFWGVFVGLAAAHQADEEQAADGGGGDANRQIFGGDQGTGGDVDPNEEEAAEQHADG